jgi:phage terminase large subunit
VTTVQVKLPPKLRPVFLGEADTRWARGGRGSAKTRSFAKMTAVRALMFAQAGTSGVIFCGRQFQNSLADSSFEEVSAAIESEGWLKAAFEVGESYIRTRCGRVHYRFAGLERNVSSIKSTSRVLIAWIDEAAAVTSSVWSVLIPTIREEHSELWVTWNPELESNECEKRFAQSTSPNVKGVTINWEDNPWFPDRLNRTRLDDLQSRPDEYLHIWEGGYKTVFRGAYYSALLAKAEAEGRICNLTADPLLPLQAFWDIGGTGAKSDATAIWICQFVAREIRVLDYYEAQGQPLAEHVGWLRKNGYEASLQVLPHDGGQHEKVQKVTYESSLKSASFNVRVQPNLGAGAVAQRVEAVRRYLPMTWFNNIKTKAGRQALNSYHEKWDEKRNIGLGANHDWASHAADAFGLMATEYKAPQGEDNKINYKVRKRV